MIQAVAFAKDHEPRYIYKKRGEIITTHQQDDLPLPAEIYVILGALILEIYLAGKYKMKPVQLNK